MDTSAPGSACFPDPYFCSVSVTVSSFSGQAGACNLVVRHVEALCWQQRSYEGKHWAAARNASCGLITMHVNMQTARTCTWLDRKPSYTKARIKNTWDVPTNVASWEHALKGNVWFIYVKLPNWIFFMGIIFIFCPASLFRSTSRLEERGELCKRTGHLR